MTSENTSQHRDLVAIATKHIGDITAIALQHTHEQAAIIVFDQRCSLSNMITAAYRQVLPSACFIDFDAVTPESILESMAPLQAGDLVVLIQTGNFRLGAFRLRIELFKRQLKVVEHPHLGRMEGAQAGYYIDALAYDPLYYRGVGNQLKQRIDAARHGRVDSGEQAQLFFDGPFEPAKLNTGDYTGMTNVGGQFPIGEVFTEALDLETVHGRVRIAVFGDTSFTVNKPPAPITLVIERGRVVAVEDSTPEFDLVLEQIRADEGDIWLRELGFGMNRALTAERYVDDIGTYERMCGIHLSLGAKHGQYAKPQIRRATARYHVDVFAATTQVLLDDVVIYEQGGWIV